MENKNGPDSIPIFTERDKSEIHAEKSVQTMDVNNKVHSIDKA